MADLTIKSTSKSSAQCSDITLRENQTTRLVFRPTIVENTRNPAAAVKGVFVFQRKGKNDIWADIVESTLTALRKGEGFKLEMHSAEMLSLYSELRALYDIHATSGVPSGEKHYVESNPHIQFLSDLDEHDLHEILNANHSLGTELFIRLLTWTLATEEPTKLVAHLTSINPHHIRDINIAFGLQHLRNVVDTWKNDSLNPDEEVWQKLLSKNSWVLEYLFSWPITVVKGKAYVGGKNIYNAGGHLVDFLLKNSLTSNAALVEIKTPVSELIGKEYRAGIFNVSSELSGSINQVLGYRHSLLTEFQSLTAGQQNLFHAFDPKCVVLIGNSDELNGDSRKRQSFELYRSQFSDVTIITFDELFSRAELQVRLLEQPVDAEKVLPF